MHRLGFMLAVGLLVFGNGSVFARDEPPYTTAAEAEGYCGYAPGGSGPFSEFSETCVYFIIGAADAIAMFASENICLPEYVYPKTLIRAFRSYVADHPDLKFVPAVTIVYMSMLEAYPCFERPRRAS